VVTNVLEERIASTLRVEEKYLGDLYKPQNFSLCIVLNYMRLDVFNAVTLYELMDSYQCFGRTDCVHLQGGRAIFRKSVHITEFPIMHYPKFMMFQIFTIVTMIWSSGLLCCIVLSVVTNILEQHIAAIFRVEDRGSVCA
jgi:hypothetical protein